MEKQVILVNEKDEPAGIAGKLDAHRRGLLHRAFSIFVFNQSGNMLLQRRALHKYHSGGLWTNTCCSHPEPGEDTREQAMKRLKEEMGFSVPLRKVFDFVYKAKFGNGLIEYEFDHVFVGEYEGPLYINQQEVMDHTYKSIQEIKTSLEKEPAQYTEWFRLAFPRVETWWKARYKDIFTA